MIKDTIPYNVKFLCHSSTYPFLLKLLIFFYPYYESLSIHFAAITNDTNYYLLQWHN